MSPVSSQLDQVPVASGATAATGAERDSSHPTRQRSAPHRSVEDAGGELRQWASRRRKGQHGSFLAKLGDDGEEQEGEGVEGRAEAGGDEEGGEAGDEEEGDEEEGDEEEQGGEGDGGEEDGHSVV
jgi:hypothetical protein